VEELLRRSGLNREEPVKSARLLTVGSVLRLARDGDVVWGTGVNGKSLDAEYGFTRLDVRAVRGPLTRDFLLARGIKVPEVYGDPGLLVGQLWTRQELARGWPKADVTVVPNLNDLQRGQFGGNILDPRRPLAECLGRIAASDFVVGSSLHGVVIAESLGIPARLIASTSEPAFKFEDYFRGTGRCEVKSATDVREAVRMGGADPPCWNPEPLVQAFPSDLWA
jgi:pyruvyltransferase